MTTDIHHSTTTRWFQPSASHYQRLALRLWAGRRWWLIALPMMVCAALSFVDVRFILVWLVLTFLVVPVVVFNVHFYNLLSPDLRRRLHWQQVTVTPEKDILVTYGYNPEGDNDGESEDEDEAVADPLPLPEPEVIDWNEVERIKLSGDCWAVMLRPSSRRKPDFLLIPKDTVDVSLRYPAYYV